MFLVQEKRKREMVLPNYQMDQREVLFLSLLLKENKAADERKGREELLFSVAIRGTRGSRRVTIDRKHKFSLPFFGKKMKRNGEKQRNGKIGRTEPFILSLSFFLHFSFLSFLFLTFLLFIILCSDLHTVSLPYFFTILP